MANLRAVSPDESPRKPRRPRVTTVSAAASKGDRLAELMAIRKVLAKTIDDSNTAPRDLAALTRRLMEVSRDIEALEVAASESRANAEESDGANDAEWRPQAI